MEIAKLKAQQKLKNNYTTKVFFCVYLVRYSSVCLNVSITKRVNDSENSSTYNNNTTTAHAIPAARLTFISVQAY